MGIDLNRFKGKKDDLWADWLADDPIPESLRARMRSNAVREASRPVARSTDQQPTVPPTTQNSQTGPEVRSFSINVTVPKVKLPNALSKLHLDRLAALPRRRFAIVGAVAAVLLVGGVATWVISDDKKPPTTGVLGEVSSKQTFKTLLPGGDVAGTTSGQVKYDAEHKIASYTDTIGGVSVNVVVQDLPQDFRQNPDEKVKNLAESISATDTITTSTPQAYIGTSAKGPQSVIFTKDGLLVLIKSVNKIDKHDWAEYITRLK